jgi:hypothetical protein
MGVFAEFERAMIRDRVKAGLERNRAEVRRDPLGANEGRYRHSQDRADAWSSGGHGAADQSGERPDARDTCTLCIAATNNAAQDRIGVRGCQRLAVGEQCSLLQNGLDVQAITLVRAIDVLGPALLCCIGKDLIKIDPGPRCRRRKRLKRYARTDADADGNCD